MCAAFFFERFVLFFCLKIERFVPDSAEIWICGLYMIAYVDKNGMITSTPPAENTPKEEIKLEEIVISTPKKDKEEPVIRRGRIEFFNESKGFGFIKDLSGVEKYFFHINNVLTDIAENNIVTFDLERGLKGMNAVNVALEVEKAKEKKENKETLNTES